VWHSSLLPLLEPRFRYGVVWLLRLLEGILLRGFERGLRIGGGRLFCRGVLGLCWCGRLAGCEGGEISELLGMRRIGSGGNGKWWDGVTYAM
jgi:hypothetical protein